MNTDNTISALIDRTLAVIDKGLDRNIGDMTLMEAIEFVGILMDMRERQLVYIRGAKPVPACTKKTHTAE